MFNKFMIIIRILFTFLAFIHYSYAANLGFLKVNSYLNQPLDAEINIINDKNFPSEYIKVVHASREDYKKFNIVKSYQFSQINLSIKEKGHNEIVVHLTTEKPIKEPLVSLVLTLRWPEGNLSKDYNFFLYPIEKPEAKEPMVLIDSGNNQGITANAQQINRKLVKIGTAKQSNTGIIRGKGEYRPDIQFNLEEFPAEYIYGPVDYGNSITLVAKKLRKDSTYSIQKIAKLLYLM